METSKVLLELACFFDVNKVYLPTYLKYTYLPALYAPSKLPILLYWSSRFNPLYDYEIYLECKNLKTLNSPRKKVDLFIFLLAVLLFLTQFDAELKKKLNTK